MLRWKEYHGRFSDQVSTTPPRTRNTLWGLLPFQEGAILELLQYEPEKQLGALGSILNSPDGRNNPRVVDVVKNLATVPAFFSLVNG